VIYGCGIGPPADVLQVLQISMQSQTLYMWTSRNLNQNPAVFHQNQIVFRWLNSVVRKQCLILEA
jgi:hypothetical protein